MWLFTDVYVGVLCLCQWQNLSNLLWGCFKYVLRRAGVADGGSAVEFGKSAGAGGCHGCAGGGAGVGAEDYVRRRVH